MEGAWEAMSRIIVQQENERQLDTIRARVIEWSNWRQGRRIARGMQTEGSEECRNCWNGAERAKMCEGSGIEVWRLGSNISAWVMSAKMEWVLRNVTQGQPPGHYCCPQSWLHWHHSCAHRVHPNLPCQPPWHHLAALLLQPDKSLQVMQMHAHGCGCPFTGSGWAVWVKLIVRVLSRIHVVPLAIVECTPFT